MRLRELSILLISIAIVQGKAYGKNDEALKAQEVIINQGNGYPEPQLSEHEKRFMANIEQLTFGGQNAEAYFSPDGRTLILQVTTDRYPCDQIYQYDLKSQEMHLVSPGKGVATCAFFLGDGERFIYASTHHAMEACPPKPDYSRGYVWPIHPEYELYMDDGNGHRTRLTHHKGYDAEAEGIDWDRNLMVFTSYRDGDLDLYRKDLETGETVQLTHQLGYDGGSFFSYSGKYIVYRRGTPETEEATAAYKRLLEHNLVRPRNLEIMVMRSDGSEKRQLTDNGAANFAPFMHPSDEHLIYSSNRGGNPREFDLWLVPREGGESLRVTDTPGFESFPMFSPDGKRIVFASNRNGQERGETNIFIADWVWPNSSENPSRGEP